MTDAPIACTLSAGDFKDRQSAIAKLNREALRKHRQRDQSLELVYDPAAAARVREFVRAEQACCAFLSFEIEEQADAVRVRITAPKPARVAAAMLFAQFRAKKALVSAGCGCS